jgi:putative acetyltransferase
MVTAMRIIRTDSSNADFRELVVLLDQDLIRRDGDEHAFYATYNKIDTIAHVVVAYQDEVAVGCGAFKRYAEQVVEIKRMFVRLECRGRGIAGLVLGELEKWAVESGYSQTILETGKKQPEAIRLYEKSGYVVIPNFGQYQGVENSVCMQKLLDF